MPKYKIINSAGIVAALGLATFPAFLSLAPSYITGNQASAEAADLATLAKIPSKIALSADSVDIELNPSADAPVFNTGSTTATVSTNNATGYTLYLSDKDTDTNLNHTLLADTLIPSITAATTESSFPTNSWGYSLDSANFSPIPTEKTGIKSRITRTDASGETTTLTFGVKADISLPSGTYKDTLLLSAITNYSADAYSSVDLWLDPATGTQITTMQQMTHDICASVPTPLAFVGGEINADVPEITLKDERDGQSYVVRKLADGNCWMSQNLRLTRETILSQDPTNTTGRITNALSDVDDDFELSPSGAPTQTETGINWNDDELNLVVRVFDTKNQDYGAIYNAYTAYAGSVTTDSHTTINNVSSLCPKNWMLPQSTNNYYGDVNETSRKTAYSKPYSLTSGHVPGSQTSTSYLNLSKVYGLAVATNSTADTGDYADDHRKSYEAMHTAPFNYVNEIYWYGRFETGIGLYWSGSWTWSDGQNTFLAYRMALTNNRFNPTTASPLYYGHPVRCLAR